ncbi:MAG: hypothetical protein ABI811_01970 [Acidobacteriota bacterium]
MSNQDRQQASRQENSMPATSIDDVLQKHLGRVPAPDQLWQQIHRPARAVPTGTAWMAWAAAAATIVLTAGGWTLWQKQQKPVSVESLAVTALNRTTDNLPLHSEDASQVRSWVKANSGIDIPLPPQHSPLVRIIGANVTTNGVPVAEVSYQVGEYRAALMVTKDPTGATTYPNHDLRKARVSSWSMKGQSYTLAFASPGESSLACLLCHGQEPSLGTSPTLMN